MFFALTLIMRMALERGVSVSFSFLFGRFQGKMEAVIGVLSVCGRARRLCCYFMGWGLMGVGEAFIIFAREIINLKNNGKSNGSRLKICNCR